MRPLFKYLASGDVFSCKSGTIDGGMLKNCMDIDILKVFSIKNKSIFENFTLNLCRQVDRWLNLQFTNFDPLTPKHTGIGCSNIPELQISEAEKFF